VGRSVPATPPDAGYPPLRHPAAAIQESGIDILKKFALLIKEVKNLSFFAVLFL
jgi:hypothetical protein